MSKKKKSNGWKIILIVLLAILTFGVVGGVGSLFSTEESGGSSSGGSTKKGLLAGSETGYYITFDANGGEWHKSGLTYEKYTVPTDKNGKISVLYAPFDPVWEGSYFNGWYTEEKGGVKADIWRNFTKDTTIYAQWTMLSRTITFDANGGTFADGSETATAKTNTDGQLTELPDDPTYGDYILLGWFLDGEQITASTVFTKSTTVSALWFEPIQSTVTFNANGGAFADGTSETTVETDEIGRLEAAPEITPPTGRSLNGWYTAIENGEKVSFPARFTSDVTLYAIWNEPYTITFNLNGDGAAFADGTTVSKELTTDSDGKLAELPANPTRSGYAFDGWYIDGADLNALEDITFPGQTLLDYVFDRNMTVYAIWQEKTYSVTFNTNGGAFADGTIDLLLETDVYGKVGTLPSDVTLAGYSFVGWFTETDGGSKIYTSTKFTEDTTVYAHWRENVPTTITLNANGGTFADGATTKTVETNEYGYLTTIPEEEPEKTSEGEIVYVFDGWYTTATGGSKLYTTTLHLDPTATYYAHWNELQPFDVHFDANGGTFSDGNDYKDLTTDLNGKLATFPEDPTRNGYVFGGWYIDSDTPVTSAYKFTDDETVRAVWTELENEGEEAAIWEAAINGERSVYYGGDETSENFKIAFVFDSAAIKELYGASFSDSDDGTDRTVEFTIGTGTNSLLYKFERLKVVVYKNGVATTAIAPTFDYTITDENDDVTGSFISSIANFFEDEEYVAVVRIYAVPEIDVSEYVTYYYGGINDEDPQEHFLTPIVHEIMEDGSWKLYIHTKYEILLTEVSGDGFSYGFNPVLPFGGFYVVPAPPLDEDGALQAGYHIEIYAMENGSEYTVVIEDSTEGITIIVRDTAGNVWRNEEIQEIGLQYRRVVNEDGTVTFDFYFNEDSDYDITGCEKGDEDGQGTAGIQEMNTGKTCGFVIFDPSEGDVAIRLYVEAKEEE
ncbi:MAG: InlB B-repeat-containing protein [Clostridia bacterium]|nr:InlB B-repeat-containing protein [Clostridia bacterium]